MEGDNDIFLAGGDGLVYLAKPMHKRYSTTFAWGYPFSTYVFCDQFFNPLPQYAPVHILDEPLPFPMLRTYLMNGLFLNKKNK